MISRTTNITECAVAHSWSTCSRITACTSKSKANPDAYITSHEIGPLGMLPTGILKLLLRRARDNTSSCFRARLNREIGMANFGTHIGFPANGLGSSRPFLHHEPPPLCREIGLLSFTQNALTTHTSSHLLRVSFYSFACSNTFLHTWLTFHDKLEIFSFTNHNQVINQSTTLPALHHVSAISNWRVQYRRCRTYPWQQQSCSRSNSRARPQQRASRYLINKQNVIPKSTKVRWSLQGARIPKREIGTCFPHLR